MRFKLLAEGKPASNSMFKGEGQYATLEKRIDGSHDLKLIDDVTCADAHLLRRVRNKFAHERDRLHFDSKKIVGLLAKMSTYEAAEHNQDAFLACSDNIIEQTRRAIEALKTTPQ